MNTPKLFSIVTVVFNNVQGIRRTIESVISQSVFDDVEYIIIDGGSTDGTLDIIQEYRDSLTHYITETDNGVYDAMNKALALASGVYICFMNSGDEFYSSDVLQKIKTLEPQNNAIMAMYGDHVLSSHDAVSNLSLKRCQSISGLWKKMCFSHQSFFVLLSWHKRHPFSANNLAADHSLIYTCSKKYDLYYLDFVVSKYETGGMSEKYLIRSTFHRFKYLLTRSKENKIVLSSYYLLLIAYLTIKRMNIISYDR